MEKKPSTPVVSVVIPSLNQGAFLEDAIESVLQQDYPSIELIIIDGGSTDNSLEVLRRYRSRIAHWQSRPDRGQSHALNQGFERATGEVMAWLNSDDLLLPGAIRTAVGLFQDDESARVVFGDWLTIDAAGRVLERHYAFDMCRLHFLVEGFTCNAQAMFWRRSVHDAFGAFDESLHRTMDYDMILRFARLVPRGFRRVDQPLAAFRRHPAQKTTGTGSPIVAAEHRRIADQQGMAWKFGYLGVCMRPIFRVRRAWWYARRGGWSYTRDMFRSRSRGIF